MTTREEVQEVGRKWWWKYKKWCEDENIPEQSEPKLMDELAAVLAALRLAEQLEALGITPEAIERLLKLLAENKDRRLAVVDSSDRPMIDPVVPVTSDDQFYDNDYRKVVAQ